MKQPENPTFGRITSLKPPLNQNEELIDGYCIPLDGEEVRVFVARKKSGREPGYKVRIMYHWGDDIGISLDNAQLYPQANDIFDRHRRGEWVTEDPLHRGSKSISFGMEEKDKDAALELMHQIVKEVQ